MIRRQVLYSTLSLILVIGCICSKANGSEKFLFSYNTLSHIGYEREVIPVNTDIFTGYNSGYSLAYQLEVDTRNDIYYLGLDRYKGEYNFQKSTGTNYYTKNESKRLTILKFGGGLKKNISSLKSVRFLGYMGFGYSSHFVNFDNSGSSEEVGFKRSGCTLFGAEFSYKIASTLGFEPGLGAYIRYEIVRIGKMIDITQVRSNINAQKINLNLNRLRLGVEVRLAKFASFEIFMENTSLAGYSTAYIGTSYVIYFSYFDKKL
ncbi:hypothetical protein K8I28_05570 [bacterium]|nr:hypothetical protein [bacterium]